MNVAQCSVAWNNDGAITAAAVVAQVLIVMSSPKGLQLGNNSFIKILQHSNSNAMPPANSYNVVGIGVGAFIGGIVVAMLFFGIVLTVHCIR